MKINADTLLVTVTTVETRAALDVFEAATGQSAALKMDPGLPCHDLGEVSGSRVVVVQSEMGTSGPGGSLLTVSEAIRALQPAAVIMTGIAFGMDPSGQAIGDILVSENLRSYELQRVSTAAGQPHIVLRSDRPHAATALLRRCKAAQYYWTGAKLYFGLVLSGEKLVDNLAFREQLRVLEPKALGGEMEGAGLYAACQDAKVILDEAQVRVGMAAAARLYQVGLVHRRRRIRRGQNLVRSMAVPAARRLHVAPQPDHHQAS